MYRFFETIKCVDGEAQLLDFHNQRIRKTMQEVLGLKPKIDLEDLISVPCDFKQGIKKIKVTYSKYIESVEFENYDIKAHKKIKVIVNDGIEYKYKSTNRDALNSFLIENPHYDDVIFVKNNHLTDATYSNLVLEKDGIWFTPDTPLLYGVKRRHLIENEIIISKNIHFNEINNFQRIGFINAMRDFEKIYTFVLNQNNELELCQANS